MILNLPATGRFFYKTKMKKLINLIILFLTVSITSCGTYEDDPLLSFRPVEKKITGLWEIEKAYENGVQQELESYEKGSTMELSENGDFKLTYIVGSTQSSYNGKWSLEEDETLFHYEYRLLIYQTYYYIDEDFTILRLTSKEFWFEQTDGRICYTFHYKAK